MLHDALSHQQHCEVVTHEHVVLLVHINITQGHEEVMQGLVGFETQQLLLDGWVSLFDHPELLVSRVFHDAISEGCQKSFAL